MSNSQEQEWRQIAIRTARKVNFGWWLERARVPLMLTAFVFAAVVLWRRHQVEFVEWNLIAAAYVGISLLVSFVCYLFVRSKFESASQSFVRLESHHQLNSALTAANAGVAPWPKIPEALKQTIEWRKLRMLIPIFGSMAVLLTSGFIPISPAEESKFQSAPPKSFTDLAESLEELALNEVVDEEYLDQMQEDMDELEKANSDDWFNHSSLEAIDSLKEAHMNQSAELAQSLRKSENALQQLKQHGDAMTQKNKERLMNEFNQALEAMEQSGMKPNKKLLEQLKNLDPSMLDGLSEEQLQQMREKMREHAERLKNQSGDIGPEPDEGEEEGGPG